MVLGFVLLYCSLFLFNSLNRTRNFKQDGMNYVDVAQNIRNGKGITQSALGYAQAVFPVEDDIPTPHTIHPPLYPLVIAAFTYLGLSAPNAALLIPVLAYALLLVAAYFLALMLYGRQAALLCVALLLVYDPLVFLARFAMAETLAMLLLLVGFLLLIREGNQTAFRGWVALVAGILFGLAFDARYAMAPGLPVGLLALGISSYLRSDRWQLLASRAALLVGGFAISAGPLLARNLTLTGSMLGAATLPLTLSPFRGLRDTLNSLAGHYLGRYPSESVQELLLSVLLLGLVIALLWQRRLWPTLREILLQNGSYVLTLWVLTYTVFVVYGRMKTFFDLDWRTVLPAGLILALFLGGLAASVSRRQVIPLRSVVVVLVGVALFREVRLAAEPPAPTNEEIIANSDRLNWVATQTSERDLIAGLETESIPFYLDRGVLCFHYLPYGEHADYGKLMTWLGRNRARYDRVFFILPTYHNIEPEAWQLGFGPFVTDLAAGRTGPYPNIRLYVHLPSADVFEIR